MAVYVLHNLWCNGCRCSGSDTTHSFPADGHGLVNLFEMVKQRLTSLVIEDCNGEWLPPLRLGVKCALGGAQLPCRLLMQVLRWLLPCRYISCPVNAPALSHAGAAVPPSAG